MAKSKKTTKDVTAPKQETAEAVTPFVEKPEQSKPKADKTVKTKPVQECFEILGERNRRYLLPDDSIVDFRFGVPINAPDLYLSGFSYLGLLPGSEHWLKDAEKEKIKKAISHRREADVKILKKLLD